MSLLWRRQQQAVSTRAAHDGEDRLTGASTLRTPTSAVPAWRTPLFMDLDIFLARHTQSIRLAVKTTHWPDSRNDSNDRSSAGVPIDPMTVAAAGIRCQSLSSGGELPC